jgi:hypothetical protein
MAPLTDCKILRQDPEGQTAEIIHRWRVQVHGVGPVPEYRWYYQSNPSFLPKTSTRSSLLNNRVANVHTAEGGLKALCTCVLHRQYAIH